MKILMVSHFCDPEPNMTRGLILARKLVELGHEVEVLTGFPNYPNGKVYPGYRMRLVHRERVDGVSIIRVAMYPSHDQSALRRVANYASFGLSAAVLGSIFTRNPDVIYAWHPPVTTGLAAIVLSVTKRAPFVYDVQDLWPDTLEATGMVTNPRMLRVVEGIVRLVHRQAARIVVQSPGFESTLVDRGIPLKKIDIVYNWAHEGKLTIKHDPAIAEAMHAGDRFNVVFAGTMGKAQGLETVLDTAENIAKQLPRVQMVLAGGGVEVEGLEAEANRRGLRNIIFLPRMPVEAVGGVLEAADVLLIHLKNVPLFEITIPNKAQDYLFAGRPIIVAAKGDVRRLIGRSGAGVACDPSDPESLGAAIAQLAEATAQELAQRGAAGRQYYDQNLSLEAGAARLVASLKKAVSLSPRRRFAHG